MIHYEIEDQPTKNTVRARLIRDRTALCLELNGNEVALINQDGEVWYWSQFWDTTGKRPRLKVEEL